jgi:hypothetical protein
MIVPKGYTEQQVIDIINNIVNRLAYKFVFGYHDIEDIKSRGWQLALAKLADGSYDGKRPLENFLYIHLKNRLGNDKRDKYERKTPPCLKCPFFDKSFPNECAAFSDKMECDKWKNFVQRNNDKKGLMKPASVEDTPEDLYFTSLTCTTDVLENMSNAEVIALINDEISIELRPLWIKIRNGIKLVKTEYKKLIEEIRQICQKNNLLSENEENSL